MSAVNTVSAMLTRLVAALILALVVSPARAAPCGGDFATFLAAMSREAQADGISRAVIDQAFAGVAQDQAVLAFDRRQRGTFRKSFEDYAATRVTGGRISRGKQLMQRHAALDRKSTRLNSSHIQKSRMPSSA